MFCDFAAWPQAVSRSIWIFTNDLSVSMLSIDDVTADKGRTLSTIWLGFTRPLAMRSIAFGQVT